MISFDFFRKSTLYHTENKDTKMSSGLTSERHTIDKHQDGGQYDIQLQEEGSMEILDSDEEGNEFPAKPGLYFKQFVKHGDDWRGVDGWYGPYASKEDMPKHVVANLTADQQ